VKGGLAEPEIIRKKFKGKGGSGRVLTPVPVGRVFRGIEEGSGGLGAVSLEKFPAKRKGPELRETLGGGKKKINQDQGLP